MAYYGQPPPGQQQPYGAPMGQPQYGQRAPGPGYGAPPQPQVDPNVLAWFQAVDVDRSGRISALELQQALTNNDWTRFSLPTCFSMIGMFDRDFSGSIDINEFGKLWGFINQWRQVFNSFDRDRSGNISHQELHQAFTQLGYRLSPKFVNIAMYKFDTQLRRSLDFEGFINCCMMLQQTSYHFQQRDTQRVGQAQYNYEDFMYTAFICLKP